MDPSSLESLRTYVGLSAEDEERLRGLTVECETALDPLVGDFYDRVMEHPETRAVLADAQQANRLADLLKQWVRTFLSGPRDAAYLVERHAIGRRHLEVGLPLFFTPLAMQVMRQHLHVLARRVARDDADRTVDAVDRALDLEQAIIISSYLDSYSSALRERERLSTVGRLAAAVGDELKNPLGVVRTSRYLIEQHLRTTGVLPGDSVVARHLERIERSATQASTLSSRLHEYARMRSPRRTTVRLREVLENSCSMVEELARALVEVRVQVSPQDAEASLDPGDIASAVAHLVRNGVQAILEDGTGRGSVEVRAETGETHTVIEVVDDGPGMDAEKQSRLFEPLFTTRSGGTGLGLGIVQNLVQGHEGNVEVHSEPGRGTRVRITIPR